MPQKIAHKERIGAGLAGISAYRVAKIVQVDIIQLRYGPNPLPCRLDRGF